MTDPGEVRTLPRTGRALASAGVVLALAWALFLLALRFSGTERPVHEAEWWIGDFALASVFALPAVVGLIALRRREHLFVCAAVLSFVLSVTLLVSVATLPLVVPGTLFLLAHRRYSGERERPARSAGVTLCLLVSAISALGVLIFSPRNVVCWQQTTYTDGTTVISRDRESEQRSSSGSISMSSGPPSAAVVSEGGGCTDGVFHPSRSALALGLVAAGGLLTWRMS